MSELAVLDVAIIDGIYASKETKRRLMDMGLIRGTRFQLRKRASLGDPNSGKSSLFNLLTRTNQRVGNWPEV
ncbi:UNVERIFIED_CONTAM: 50S ribosome-binding GTPase [Streptococcus canis]|uniref:50S ribosome-binding GTPase n=1 Tax=Streptococcus canis TaxID=1329 RepID=A0AAE4Q6R7_STRCB|nr:FeoB small GTPase domain-containing protein [Streptococcus canis]MDV5977032.1 50S ribosome-binding GTPase [Streptococcus canis]